MAEYQEKLVDLGAKSVLESRQSFEQMGKVWTKGVQRCCWGIRPCQSQKPT